MAGLCAPPGDPPDGSRCPKWMLRGDELGHTIALQMKVRISGNNTNENESESSLRLPKDPFVIGNAVLLILGAKEARKVHASKEAQGSRYILRTNSKSICGKLKQMHELPDHTPIEVIEHPTLNTVQGVLYDPDTIDQPEKYILENLEDQGITNVRRIMKRCAEKLVNTPLLVVTFNGSVLPQYVYFGVLRVKVRQYYPTPMLCYRCGNYGHSKKRCDEKRYQLICLNCSGNHEMIENTPCIAPPFCKNCKRGHSTTSKDCPVYREEEAIIRLKTDRGLTYAEARSEFRETHRGPSYSSVTQARLCTATDEKDRTIELLRKEIEALKEMISALKSQIEANQLPRSSSTSDNASMENVSISSEEPAQDKEFIEALPLASAPKAFHSSFEKIHTRSMSKSMNSTIGNEDGKNDPDSSRTNKRKGNDDKKNGSPDSPERKKGTIIPVPNKQHQSKKK